VVHLVSSFGMHARRSLLRDVQEGDYAHQHVAIASPLHNAAMVIDHFGDRDGSASALDS